MQKALLPTDPYLMSNTVTTKEAEAAASPRYQALDKAKWHLHLTRLFTGF